MNERSAIRRALGKWSEAGVPHKGWRCVDSYDSCANGEEIHLVCEMCDHQEIRYVHVMEHDNYEGRLECGCVCAAYMEQDYEMSDIAAYLEAAQDRDREMRNRTSRSVNRRKALARANSSLKELREEFDACDSAGHCRTIISDLVRLRKQAKRRRKLAKRDGRPEEAKEHKACVGRIDLLHDAAVDKLVALEERARLVDSSSSIWMDADDPLWLPAPTGRSTHLRLGPHRTWVFEKGGRFKGAIELDGGDVTWGRRSYATEEEAKKQCLGALLKMLRKRGMLLPQDEPEVKERIAFIASIESLSFDD